MNEELRTNLQTAYNTKLPTINDKVSDVLKTILKDMGIEENALTHDNIQTISASILEIETKTLHTEVENLLIEKEKIEKRIEKQSQALQEIKYDVFNALESQLATDNNEAFNTLHQIKLQEIDLYDLLDEIVESAIITAIEKDTEVYESITEVIKDITFEATKEGSLNTIRIRKILSIILQSAIEVAEATPVKADEILLATLRGMRSGLVHAISRFKQRLAFIPIEAKHILIEDYDTIIEDLHQTDTLFTQVVQTQADNSSSAIKLSLENVTKKMKYDLDDLLRLSKETAEIMKEKFSAMASKTIKKADKALSSYKVDEAKRIGKQAIGVAKNAMESALQSAKNAMDKK